jgi:hypothetical protein
MELHMPGVDFYCRISLLVLTSSLLLRCSNDLVEENPVELPKNPVEYQITRGACGRIVCQERLAFNFDDALEILERRKAEEYSDCPGVFCAEIEMQLHHLEVADEVGNVPSASFFAIQFNDRETGSSLHSVHEVLDSEGNLYFIVWCLD